MQEAQKLWKTSHVRMYGPKIIFVKTGETKESATIASVASIFGCRMPLVFSGRS